jgi:uncharacterized protein involved in type VI secretion and phage assembly
MREFDDQTLADLLERVRNRYYGKYRGSVTEVDEATFRIKAKVPAVLGQQTTGWCMPCVPYAGKGVGMAFLPEVGSGVWIEFEGGEVSYPIWVGAYWRVGETPPEAAAAVKAIVTPGKRRIVIDDDGGAIEIGDDDGNTVALNAEGISLERGAKKVVVSEGKVDVNDGAFEVT